jgi:hypothetical protein
MMYYISGIGFISGQFTKDSVQYPMDWLDKADSAELERLGAVPKPVPDADEVVEQGENGWVVRDKTQGELDSELVALHASWKNEVISMARSKLAAISHYIQLQPVLSGAINGIIDDFKADVAEAFDDSMAAIDLGNEPDVVWPEIPEGLQ